MDEAISACEYGGRCKPGECSGPCGNDPRWTQETAELMAHILHGWFGACSCESSDDGDRKCATKLLTALDGAGLLVEPGAILPLMVPQVPDNPGQTWEEWGYRVTWPGGEVVDHWGDDDGCWDEEGARCYMGYHLDDYPDTAAVLIRRTAWYATTAWEVGER